MYEFEVFNTSPVLTGGGYGRECDEIVNWELPLFDIGDLDMASISSPSGWNFELLPPDGTSNYYNTSNSPYHFSKWNWTATNDLLLQEDPNLYGSNPQVFENPPLVLHWYNPADSNRLPTNSIRPGGSLGGFSFLSNFAPKNAPYLASWFSRPPRGGDPPIPNGLTFATPNSPSRQQAQGSRPSPTTVSESDSLFGLLGLGALGILTQVKKLARLGRNSFRTSALGACVAEKISLQSPRRVHSVETVLDAEAPAQLPRENREFDLSCAGETRFANGCNSSKAAY